MVKKLEEKTRLENKSRNKTREQIPEQNSTIDHSVLGNGQVFVTAFHSDGFIKMLSQVDERHVCSHGVSRYLCK